jgi:hypothetical protein
MGRQKEIKPPQLYADSLGETIIIPHEKGKPVE